jgi:hypothetical protein
MMFQPAEIESVRGWARSPNRNAIAEWYVRTILRSGWDRRTPPSTPFPLRKREVGPGQRRRTFVNLFKGRVNKEFSTIKMIPYSLLCEDTVAETRAGG